VETEVIIIGAVDTGRIINAAVDGDQEGDCLSFQWGIVRFLLEDLRLVTDDNFGLIQDPAEGRFDA
jgi:hypothetical protein